jgi:hypothetical protein
MPTTHLLHQRRVLGAERVVVVLQLLQRGLGAALC